MKNTWKRWIVCFLALAMVIAGAGCGNGANNGPGGNDPEEKTYQTEPPEVYGFAMEVRVRARFMLYLNDRGGLIKHDALNEAAKEKGILPDPIRGSVGVMGSSQFYEAVSAVMAGRGSGVIGAYALEETDSLGPLRLRLQVDMENRAE